MIRTLLRFSLLIPALLLVLLFVLPAGLLAGLFYILSIVVQHEPIPHYRSYTDAR